jgi:FtsP/CotA-like multicopper oxidase with cupredoxin domain
MDLKIPLAGESDYATSVSTSFTNVDNHDHSSGKGTQIITGGITDLAVTSAKLAAGAVITTKITDANVTRAKLESVGQQISSSSGSHSVTTLADVTNLSINITTTGRPVMIFLIPTNLAGVSGNFIMSSNAASNTSMTITLTRGATDIAIWVASHTGSTGHSVTMLPSIIHIDPIAAGTYTYKIRAVANTASGQAYAINDVRLAAYEL